VTKTKASSAAAGKSGPTEIDGEWQMVSGVLDGVTMDASLIQWVRRVTQGGVTTVKAGPQTMMKAEFSVDRAAKPRTIDYRHLHGTHKDKTQLGIYSLKAGELTILMGAPGGARPVTFAPKPPKGGTLTVWKRV
jgi:uncharacterized protein (TIGR03067 family)